MTCEAHHVVLIMMVRKENINLTHGLTQRWREPVSVPLGSKICFEKFSTDSVVHLLSCPSPREAITPLLKKENTDSAVLQTASA